MFGGRVMKTLAMSVGSIFFLLFVGFTCLSEPADETEPIEVVINEGDTLWQIAQKYYGESRDIRAVIEEIKVYNELNDATIRPGDTLLLPR